jgi:hypothetical protein
MFIINKIKDKVGRDDKEEKKEEPKKNPAQPIKTDA